MSVITWLEQTKFLALSVTLVLGATFELLLLDV